MGHKPPRASARHAGESSARIEATTAATSISFSSTRMKRRWRTRPSRDRSAIQEIDELRRRPADVLQPRRRRRPGVIPGSKQLSSGRTYEAAVADECSALPSAKQAGEAQAHNERGGPHRSWDRRGGVRICQQCSFSRQGSRRGCGPAPAGADEWGPVNVRSGLYSSACRCHRRPTYCCPCTRSPFLLRVLASHPPVLSCSGS